MAPNNLRIKRRQECGEGWGLGTGMKPCFSERPESGSSSLSSRAQVNVSSHVSEILCDKEVCAPAVRFGQEAVLFLHLLRLLSNRRSIKALSLPIHNCLLVSVRRVLVQGACGQPLSVADL